MRANMLNIKAKLNRGLTSVNALISVWAPSSENDTAAYISKVSAALALAGVSGQHLKWESSQIIPLLKAITWVENGTNPYTNDQFVKAWEMAN